MKSTANKTSVHDLVIEDPYAGVNIQILNQLLPRQSPRWCQLTTSLWSLVALDTNRYIDANALMQFIEVIHWRAHGKITEDEFSVLFTEWIKPEAQSTKNNSNGGIPASSIKKKFNLSILLLRAYLLEKAYVESDLDLFIGILIHEINVRLLNTTISYVNQQLKGSASTLINSSSLSRQLPAFSLEVVTKRWLELSEELFFSLDTPGYGSLRFDEAFYFVSCLLIGIQGWKDEEELENSLALSNLTSITVQFMRDTGAMISTTATRSSLVNTTIEFDDHGSPGRQFRLSGNQSNRENSRMVKDALKHEITLTMFKRYLIKKNVGEGELSALLSHYKLCIERMARLVRASGADDLYQACQPYEHKGAVIGSPRLWQEAVLFASGLKPPIASSTGGMGLTVSTQPIPTILLFLLSDAEKHLSVHFRAIDFEVEGIGFGGEDRTLVGNNSGNLSVDYSNPIFSVLAANEELHDNAKRIFTYFRKWGQDSTGVSTGGGVGSKMNNYLPNPSELQRDPTYQLILSTLLHYKRLQQILNAALYDFSIHQYGVSPLNINIPPNPLAILTSGLTPIPREVLIELGVIREEPLARGGEDMYSVGEENQSTSSRSTALSLTQQPIIPQTAQNLPTGTNQMQLTELSESLKGISNPPSQQNTSNNKTKKPEENRDDDKPFVTAKINPGSAPTGEKKPLNSGAPAPSTTFTAVGGNTPNFLKPTQTSMAKAKTKNDQEDPIHPDDHSDTTGYSSGARHRSSPTSTIAGASATDSDVMRARWQPLLDVRANTGLPPVPTEITSTAPIARKAFPNQQPGSVAAKLSSSVPEVINVNKPLTNETPKPVTSAPGNGATPLVLNEEESQLLAILLSSSDPRAQAHAMEQLRNKVAPNTAGDTSPVASRSTNNNAAMNLNEISPLSVSPKPPQQQQSNRGNTATNQPNRATSANNHTNPNKIANNPAPNNHHELVYNFNQSYGSNNPNLVNSRLDGVLLGDPSVDSRDYSDPSNLSSNRELSDVSTSTAPSSIQELLQQGQNPGKYAAMLRDILRKMSKDDSNVKLKSLEQVLKLGQNIVQNDSEEKKKKQLMQQQMAAAAAANGAGIPSMPTSPTMNNLVTESGANTSPAQMKRNAAISNSRGPVGSQSQNQSANSAAPFGSAGSGNNAASGGARVIQRTSRAPGLMPDKVEKKSKKAFGHPINT